MSIEKREELLAKRDQLILDAERACNAALLNGSVDKPRYQKDARIYIDWASDALAEASRIDKMIGLL